MKKSVVISRWFVMAALWLPAAGIAGEVGTVPKQPVIQETQPKSASASTSSAEKDKRVKKSDQENVKSRGLFKKKKKKQKSGATSHSQPSELTEPGLPGGDVGR
jgi:hypothetical protein